MASKGRRAIRLGGLFGPLRFSRPYWYCPKYRTSCTPDDDRYSVVSQSTRAAREMISLAGVLDSFAEAAERLLPRFCGLSVSAFGVQRITEAVGTSLGEQLANGQVPSSPTNWDWYEDAEHKCCAYLSCDATGVGQQASDGSSAEGLLTGPNLSWQKSFCHWWCHLLKREGVDRIVELVEGLDLSDREGVEQGRKSLLCYLKNHGHKMDDPRYRKLGWSIGSGQVESACKNVVGRLKGPGMCWSEEGTAGVCHLRAFYKRERDAMGSLLAKRLIQNFSDAHPPNSESGPEN